MTKKIYKTFASYSFGCRVNQAEKEMLNRQLSAVNYQYSENNPSIYIINTCAVTQKAEREARQLIYQTKRKWPKTKIVVTGCAATKWINEGTKIPQVDWLIDNTNKEYIAQLLSSKLKDQRSNSKLKTKNLNTLILEAGDTGEEANIKQPKIPILKTELNAPNDSSFLGVETLWKEKSDRKRLFVSEKFGIETVQKRNINKYLNSGRLLLKIQDGCQRYCTFCIVPYLRGQPKSKSIKEIIREINCHTELVSASSSNTYEIPKQVLDDIIEVILTAINTEAYGYDTGESFITLINRIIEVTKVPRISFGSIHPWSLNNDFLTLIDKMDHKGRIVNYFHIPLQSGSNKILSLMKRGYTCEEFIEKLDRLHRINPLAFIGTDIIVGFLEETDKDFEDTYNFLKDSPISKFHVFRFSPREKTAAFYMKKRLKEPTPAQKTKRAQVLIELSRQKYQRFLEKHIGKTFPALFMEKRIDDFQEALLDNQVPALIITTKNLTGEIETIKIEAIKEEKLIGKRDDK